MFHPETTGCCSCIPSAGGLHVNGVRRFRQQGSSGTRILTAECGAQTRRFDLRRKEQSTSLGGADSPETEHISPPVETTWTRSPYLPGTARPSISYAKGGQVAGTRLPLPSLLAAMPMDRVLAPGSLSGRWGSFGTPFRSFQLQTGADSRQHPTFWSMGTCPRYAT